MNNSLTHPGAVAASETGVQFEPMVSAAAGSCDFSNLLLSLVTAVPQVVVGAENLANDGSESLGNGTEMDQVPRQLDDSSIDLATLCAFIAHFPPTTATPEPAAKLTKETASVTATPLSEVIKIQVDCGVEGAEANDQPARFMAPPELTVTTAAWVQQLDDKNDRRSFADELAPSPSGDDAVVGVKAPPRAGAAATSSNAAVHPEMAAQPQFSKAGELPDEMIKPRVEQQPSKRAAVNEAEPIRSAPADVDDSVACVDDGPTVARKEFRLGDGERNEPKNDAQYGSTDAESIALNRSEIEATARQVRPAAQAQASLAFGREKSPAGQAHFKPPESTAEPGDGSLARSLPMTADTLAAKPSPIDGAIEPRSGPEWQPIVGRVTEQIVRQVRIGERQAIIELAPPGLGKIKIELRVDGEQIHARIIAEEQSTKALIESRLTELHQALEVRQVELANLRVDQQNVSSGGGDWGQTFSNGDQRPGGGPAHDDSRFADRLADDAPQDNSQSPARDPGRISMWA